MSRFFGSAVLVTALLAVIASVSLVSSTAAQERAGDPAKWRALWEEMKPVYMHARCFNCHNKVNPRLPDPENNHGGGELELPEQFACIGCHTANTTVVEGTCELNQFSGRGRITLPDGTTVNDTPCVPNEGPKKIRIPKGPVWNARGPDFSEDIRELCRMVKNGRTPEQFLDHVQNDALIDFAFKGDAAVDNQSDHWPVELEKPPLDKPAFVKLVTRWITEAAMACGTDGTVTLDDTTKLDSRTAFAKSKTRNETTANIRIDDDVAQSELHYGEASDAKISTMLPGCPARESVEAHFKADGRPDTSYEINILPNNTYRMRFILGPVEGQTVWSYKEQLCRPGTRGREKLPTEMTIPLRFGVEDQVPHENEKHELILKGSATIPYDMSVGPVAGSNEQKVTWDLVIK